MTSSLDLCFVMMSVGQCSLRIGRGHMPGSSAHMDECGEQQPRAGGQVHAQRLAGSHVRASGESKLQWFLRGWPAQHL